MKEFLNFPSPMLASCPLPWHPPLVWAEACSAPPCLLSLAVTGYRCSFCFKPLTCLTPVGILHRDHSLAVLSEDREGGGGLHVPCRHCHLSCAPVLHTCVLQQSLRTVNAPMTPFTACGWEDRACSWPSVNKALLFLSLCRRFLSGALDEP